MLRKTFLLFVIILFSNNVNSQSFTLDELIELLNGNMDSFDSKLLSNNFKFSFTKSDNETDEFVYVYDQKSEGFAVKYMTKYNFKEDHQISIVYQTPKSDEYISIKNRLKVLGYKFISTETGKDGTMFLYYVKGIYKLTLASSRKENSSGTKIGIYEITITKSQI
jgi:hypothetical protein